jgi:hypothetical protein
MHACMLDVGPHGIHHIMAAMKLQGWLCSLDLATLLAVHLDEAHCWRVTEADAQETARRASAHWATDPQLSLDGGDTSGDHGGK